MLSAPIIFSWIFPGFDNLQNLHWFWIERLPSFTDMHRAAEVPICFPFRSIAHYLICFRQHPRCRILSARNADADVAAAGASCRDGRGEEDVYNGHAGERTGHGRGGRLWQGRPQTSAAAAAGAAANLKPVTAAPAARLGELPPGTAMAKQASTDAATGGPPPRPT